LAWCKLRNVLLGDLKPHNVLVCISSLITICSPSWLFLIITSYILSIQK
jgi:hypothetical protein